jgi:hypothetical protein
MILITGGCSFTAHQVRDKLSWANQLDERDGYTVINTAEMASGNGLISRNILEAAEQYKSQDPKVCIMWSSPNRFELFYDSKHPVQKEMRDHPAFYNHTWLKTGGGYGNWTFGSAIADKDTRTYLTYFHNQEYQFMKTLEHILRIQWYCKINNLKLYNFCWQNIFWGANDVHGSSHKPEHTFKPIVDTYPSCTHLWDMIDWKDWHLYKNGGLWEFCIDKGYDLQSGTHPSTEVQRQWLDEIVVPLLNR